MAYLVDTNVMVDFTRGNIDAADCLDGLRGDFVLSSVTALELIAGARNQREVADLDASGRETPSPSPATQKSTSTSPVTSSDNSA